MASRTLRRRLHHGDVDGKKNDYFKTSGIDDLNEPLLGNHDEYDDGHSEQNNLRDKSWDDEENKQRRHWTSIFSNLIAQWAQWLAHIVLGSGSVIGKLISFNGEHRKNTVVSLTPLQEERLKSLQQRLGIPFDGTLAEHQDALKQLWRLAYPDRELPPLKSELWKEMGWQGTDPSTDFRGGGFVSLENLIFFAKKYPESFHKLLLKKEGRRAEWEYPFAVAGINISFMLAQMLDLQSVILVSQSSSFLDVLLRCMGCERDTATLNGKPSSIAGSRFLELLGEDEMAFDNLYCVAFQMMDAQWLAKRASYMEFNEVLKSTRVQLERELALEDVSTVKDLPAYNLLNR